MSGVIFKQGLMEVNPELLHYLERNESFNSGCFLVDIQDNIGAVGVDAHGYAGVFACLGISFSVGEAVNHGFKFIQRLAGDDEFKSVIAGPGVMFVKGCFKLFYGFFHGYLLIFI